MIKVQSPQETYRLVSSVTEQTPENHGLTQLKHARTQNLIEKCLRCFLADKIYFTQHFSERMRERFKINTMHLSALKSFILCSDYKFTFGSIIPKNDDVVTIDNKDMNLTIIICRDQANNNRFVAKTVFFTDPEISRDSEAFRLDLGEYHNQLCSSSTFPILECLENGVQIIVRDRFGMPYGRNLHWNYISYEECVQRLINHDWDFFISFCEALKQEMWLNGSYLLSPIHFFETGENWAEKLQLL